MKKFYGFRKGAAAFLTVIMAVTMLAGVSFAEIPEKEVVKETASLEAEDLFALFADSEDGLGLSEDIPDFDFGSPDDLLVGEDDEYDIIIEEETPANNEEETGEILNLSLEEGTGEETAAPEEAALEEETAAPEDTALEEEPETESDQELAKEEALTGEQDDLSSEKVLEDPEAGKGEVSLSALKIQSEVDALESRLAEEGLEYDGFLVSLKDDAENLAKGDERTNTLDYTEDIVLADSAEAIINDYDYSDIEMIEPNYVSYLDEGELDGTVLTEEEMASMMEAAESSYDSVTNPNDEYFDYYQYNLRQVHFPYAWSKGLSGSRLKGSGKVVVAVIDTGIYRGHQDLKSSHLLSGKNCYTYRYSNDMTDFIGHGTACASVIMATRNNYYGMTGAAPNVYVLPVKIFGTQNSTDDASIVSGINYAVSRGVDVISMSVSGPGSTTAKQNAVRNAEKKGVIFVGSAGNGYNRGYYTDYWCKMYPAAYSTVIGVASVNSYNSYSSFSQREIDTVYCTANGESVVTCGTYYDSYKLQDGTSFSCPTVAAAAALAKSVNPKMSPSYFRKLLRATCTDLGSYGKDMYYGYGLLNMTKLTKKLLQPKKIKLNKKKISLAAGKSYRLKATITPSYAADKRVTWTSSKKSVVRVSSGGKIRALRYGSATITAKSKAKPSLKAKCKVTVLFKDVAKRSKYYYKPVYWAAKKGITKGISKTKFGPNKACTRKQMVLFLWRLSKKPKVSGSMKFRDCRYGRSTDTYKAIVWATKKGIIKGYSGRRFKPNAYVTRKQAVLMLWRYAGKPKVSGSMAFRDCRKFSKRSDSYKAIRWGARKGIVGGYSDNTFRPNWRCRRAHIVSFIYRYKH